MIPGNQILPDVLHLSNGNTVVAYTSGPLADGYALLDFYGPDHQVLHANARLPFANPANTSAYNGASLIELANGDVLVAWANADAGNLGIKAAMFTAGGEYVGTEMTLVSGLHFAPNLVPLNDGGFAMSYWLESRVYLRCYNSDGTQRGQVVSMDPDAPMPWETNGRAHEDNAVTALADGAFVVTWMSHENDLGAEGWIHARIFNADGTARTGVLLVDVIGDNFSPQTVGLPNGNWAVVYSDTAWGENGSSGISLKIMSPTGAQVTAPVHVNTGTPLRDHAPTVTVLENGFLLVSWSKEVSADTFDIYGRLFSSSGTPVTVDGNNAEFLISSTSGNDRSSALDTLGAGAFIAAWKSEENGGVDIAATIKELVRDTVGDGADDTFTGDALRDAVYGGGGNDILDGAAGDDALSGGAGLDTLIGGIGSDRVTGGSGSDTFVFRPGDGDDTIVDFSQGPVFRDKIDLGAFPALTIVDVLARTSQVGADTVIDFGGSNSLTLLNMQKASLTAADFVGLAADDGDPLFDSHYYLSHNPDVLAAGIDPLVHFNAAGWHEGRDPNAFFDTSGYLAVNKDVAAAGMNPLEHYRQSGWHEGRDPGASFDTTLYLINNPDVAAAGMNPLAHYLASGMAEGRQAYAAVGQSIVGGFDAQYYLFHNPDVAAAGVDPLLHYNMFGWHEGRNPNGYFDTSGYLAHYGDVAAAGINPLQHYQASGWHEGRDPSAQFDTVGYLAENPDVAAANYNPLDHYLIFGIYEGRAAVNDGVWS
jgi:Ca2+-binding RTX toxin-like protein